MSVIEPIRSVIATIEVRFAVAGSRPSAREVTAGVFGKGSDRRHRLVDLMGDAG